MMQPVLKQRKTKIVSGWLTRDTDGMVTLWNYRVGRDLLSYRRMGRDGEAWWRCELADCRLFSLDAREFKALYTGIPRKGRAVHVDIEIVVD